MSRCKSALTNTLRQSTDGSTTVPAEGGASAGYAPAVGAAGRLYGGAMDNYADRVRSATPIAAKLGADDFDNCATPYATTVAVQLCDALASVYR